MDARWLCPFCGRDKTETLRGLLSFAYQVASDTLNNAGSTVNCECGAKNQAIDITIAPEGWLYGPNGPMRDFGRKP